MGVDINFKYLKTPSGILKIPEILFVVIAFGMFRGVPVDFAEADANYFGGGVLVACLIITPLLLVCYLMNRMEIQSTILELTLNFLFAVFLFSVSVRAFVFWSSSTTVKDDEYKSEALTMASFTFLASIAYMGDIFFSGKNLKDAYEGGGGF